MQAWWACKDNGNFGDRLTPYIIHKLTGAWPKHSQAGPHFILAGSILGEITAESVVIGAGYGDKAHRSKTRRARILAVRGPISGGMLVGQGYNSHNWIYGDPGLVLPLLYPRTNAQPDIELGVFPHYVDAKLFGLKHFVIDPLAPVEDVLERMFRCKKIVTSSLHGLIAGQVYGIPTRLVSFGGKIAGDGMKYLDYQAATNQALSPPMQVRPEDINNLHAPPIQIAPHERLLALLTTTLRDG